MHWTDIKKEIENEKPSNPDMMQITMEKVRMSPEDIEHLIDLMGGEEEYDNEGNLSFAKLKDLFNPSFVKAAEKEMGATVPLNEWEEASHWQQMLSDFKSKGQEHDNEAVILPSNIIALFDKITGMKNINPRTGHKQYVSMSGFLNNLSSMLPFFSNRQAVPQAAMGPVGPLNMQAPNMGPQMSSMFGLPGHQTMSNIGSALSSLGSNFASGLNRMGQNAYNSMPSNPFRRQAPGVPAGMAPMPMAPAGGGAPRTWEQRFGDFGESAGRYFASMAGSGLGNLAGTLAGTAGGAAMADLAPHPIPRALARAVFGGLGGLAGGPIMRAFLGNLGGRLGANLGRRGAATVGRGADYLSGAAQTAIQNPRQAAINSGGALASMFTSPASMITNRIAQNPAWVDQLGRGGSGTGGSAFGMPGFTDMSPWGPGTPLLNPNRDRSDSLASFRTADGGNDWPWIDEPD